MESEEVVYARRLRSAGDPTGAAALDAVGSASPTPPNGTGAATTIARNGAPDIVASIERAVHRGEFGGGVGAA